MVKEVERHNPSVVALARDNLRLSLEGDAARVLAGWGTTTREEEPAYSALFDRGELDAAVRGMGKGKAPGWDGIPHECLKAMGEDGRTMLLGVINALWVAEDVPPCWKEGILCPIPKTGDPSRIANLRPVCLLVAMGKLLEAMVGERAKCILDGPTRKRLTNATMGFRGAARATQCVLRLTQAVEEAWARKRDLLCVMMDVEGAFDILRPELMPLKLQALGFRGRMARFLCNYVKGRTARVRMGGGHV